MGGREGSCQTEAGAPGANAPPHPTECEPKATQAIVEVSATQAACCSAGGLQGARPLAEASAQSRRKACQRIPHSLAHWQPRHCSSLGTRTALGTPCAAQAPSRPRWGTAGGAGDGHPQHPGTKLVQEEVGPLGAVGKGQTSGRLIPHVNRVQRHLVGECSLAGKQVPRHSADSGRTEAVEVHRLNTSQQCGMTASKANALLGCEQRLGAGSREGSPRLALGCTSQASLGIWRPVWAPPLKEDTGRLRGGPAQWRRGGLQAKSHVEGHRGATLSGACRAAHALGTLEAPSYQVTHYLLPGGDLSLKQAA